MTVVIGLSARQEARALPILLRHSSGTVFPCRTYVISREVARALRQAGINFIVLSRDPNPPGLEEAGPSESI